MPWDPKDIENDFTYRSATGGNGGVQQALRDNAIAFLKAINDFIPDGKEKDQAYYRVTEVIFWLTAAYERSIHTETATPTTAVIPTVDPIQPVIVSAPVPVDPIPVETPTQDPVAVDPIPEPPLPVEDTPTTTETAPEPSLPIAEIPIGLTEYTGN